MAARTTTPTPIHTACDARRTSVNASPVPAANPKAPKAAASAPSSVPRLAGMKKVTKRTADQRASMIGRGHERRGQSETLQDQHSLDGAQQPADEVETDRREEPAPP